MADVLTYDIETTSGLSQVWAGTAVNLVNSWSTFELDYARVEARLITSMLDAAKRARSKPTVVIIDGN